MNPNANPMDFSFDVAGVDTSFPCLTQCDVAAKLVKWEMKKTKNEGEHMVVFGFETMEPAHDTKGILREPGFKVRSTMTLPIPGKQGDNDEMRFKAMASLIDAFEGTNETNRTAKFSPQFLNEVAGKKVVQLVIKTAKDPQYGETEVKGYNYLPSGPAGVAGSPGSPNKVVV